MAAISPYLVFADNCEEAFNFYKSVFGGEFNTIMRFEDSPPEHKPAEKEKRKIMHIDLPIGKDDHLMGSDSPDHMGPIVKGSNFTVAIHTESKEEATRLFNGLSTGGIVTMPLSDAFWDSYFGMFTDKFGMHWLVNYDHSQKK